MDDLCPWRGMPIIPNENIARAALLGVVADMPATRKLTGYLCHKGIMPTTIVTSFYPFEEGLAHLQFVA